MSVQWPMPSKAPPRRIATRFYGGGDIPIWCRTSAEVAHESAKSFPRASHSAALNSSLREAARCHSACRDRPSAAPISCHVRSCDRATFTASLSIAEKYLWNAEIALETSMGSAFGFLRRRSQSSQAALMGSLSNQECRLSRFLDGASVLIELGPVRISPRVPYVTGIPRSRCGALTF